MKVFITITPKSLENIGIHWSKYVVLHRTSSPSGHCRYPVCYRAPVYLLGSNHYFLETFETATVER